MATKIYFIVGPEAAYKEKVINDLTNMYFNEGKTCVTKYKAARIDNLHLYGTLPAWAVADRVDSVIYNTTNTCDVLIIAGWHLPDIIQDLQDKYPESTIVLVRSSKEDTVIKARMVDTVGETQADEVITSENTYIANYLKTKELTPNWVKVSEDPANRVFNNDKTINEVEAGCIEIALLGDIS
jgi:hypothetical protein